MARKANKIISLFLSFLFLFQQTGFSQAVNSELNLSGLFQNLSGQFKTDTFRPIHLRSVSYNDLDKSFKLLLDKGTKEENLESQTQTLFDYFLIGLSLNNSSFWVNLRPDSPDSIIDPSLEQTDIGRTLLEADVQLKKDTAKLTSPATPEGKAYWDSLYRRAEELFGTENIIIPTLTRPWIVPDEVIIRETSNQANNPQAYIYKATLKVMLEDDYLKQAKAIATNVDYSFSDPRLKKLNSYSTKLIKELIIPKLTKEVNSSKRYAPLRQVYYSLILAQWFKKKQGDASVPLVLSKMKTEASPVSWNKQTYFKQYQDSFNKGEYNLKEQRQTLFGPTIRSYTSGGIQLDIPIQALSSPITGNPSLSLTLPNTELITIDKAGSVGVTKDIVMSSAVKTKFNTTPYLTGDSETVYSDINLHKKALKRYLSNTVFPALREKFSDISIEEIDEMFSLLTEIFYSKRDTSVKNMSEGVNEVVMNFWNELYDVRQYKIDPIFKAKEGTRLTFQNHVINIDKAIIKESSIEGGGYEKRYFFIGTDVKTKEKLFLHFINRNEVEFMLADKQVRNHPYADFLEDLSKLELDNTDEIVFVAAHKDIWNEGFVIATKFIQGRNLGEYIDELRSKQEPLRNYLSHYLQETIRIGKSLLRIITDLNAVHADLHYENIQVSDSSDRFFILDFERSSRSSWANFDNGGLENLEYKDIGNLAGFMAMMLSQRKVAHSSTQGWLIINDSGLFEPLDRTFASYTVDTTGVPELNKLIQIINAGLDSKLSLSQFVNELENYMAMVEPVSSPVQNTPDEIVESVDFKKADFILKRYPNDARFEKARKLLLKTMFSDAKKRKIYRYHNEYHVNEVLEFVDSVIGQINIVKPDLLNYPDRLARLLHQATLFHDIVYNDSGKENHEELSKEKLKEFQGYLGLSDLELGRALYFIDKTKFSSEKMGKAFEDEVKADNRAYSLLKEKISDVKKRNADYEFLKGYLKSNFGIPEDNLVYLNTDDTGLIMDAIIGGKIMAVADVYGQAETYPYTVVFLWEEFEHEDVTPRAKTRLEQVANTPYFLDEIAVNNRLRYILDLLSDDNTAVSLPLGLFIPLSLKNSRRKNIELLKRMKIEIEDLKARKISVEKAVTLKAFIAKGKALEIYDEETFRNLYREIAGFTNINIHSKKEKASFEVVKEKIKQNEKVNIVYMCQLNKIRSFLMEMTSRKVLKSLGLTNVTVRSCGISTGADIEPPVAFKEFCLVKGISGVEIKNNFTTKKLVKLCLAKGISPKELERFYNVVKPSPDYMEICLDNGIEQKDLDEYFTTQVSWEILESADIVIVAFSQVLEYIENNYPDQLYKVAFFSKLLPEYKKLWQDFPDPIYSKGTVTEHDFSGLGINTEDLCKALGTIGCIDTRRVGGIYDIKDPSKVKDLGPGYSDKMEVISNILQQRYKSGLHNVHRDGEHPSEFTGSLQDFFDLVLQGVTNLFDPAYELPSSAEFTRDELRGKIHGFLPNSFWQVKKELAEKIMAGENISKITRGFNIKQGAFTAFNLSILYTMLTEEEKSQIYISEQPITEENGQVVYCFQSEGIPLSQVNNITANPFVWIGPNIRADLAQTPAVSSPVRSIPVAMSRKIVNTLSENGLEEMAHSIEARNIEFQYRPSSWFSGKEKRAVELRKNERAAFNEVLICVNESIPEEDAIKGILQCLYRIFKNNSFYDKENFLRAAYKLITGKDEVASQDHSLTDLDEATKKNTDKEGAATPKVDKETAIVELQKAIKFVRFANLRLSLGTGLPEVEAEVRRMLSEANLGLGLIDNRSRNTYILCNMATGIMDIFKVLESSGVYLDGFIVRFGVDTWLVVNPQKKGKLNQMKIVATLLAMAAGIKNSEELAVIREVLDANYNHTELSGETLSKIAKISTQLYNLQQEKKVLPKNYINVVLSEQMSVSSPIQELKEDGQTAVVDLTGDELAKVDELAGWVKNLVEQAEIYINNIKDGVDVEKSRTGLSALVDARRGQSIGFLDKEMDKNKDNIIGAILRPLTQASIKIGGLDTANVCLKNMVFTTYSAYGNGMNPSEMADYEKETERVLRNVFKMFDSIKANGKVPVIMIEGKVYADISKLGVESVSSPVDVDSSVISSLDKAELTYMAYDEYLFLQYLKKIRESYKQDIAIIVNLTNGGRFIGPIKQTLEDDNIKIRYQNVSSRRYWGHPYSIDSGLLNKDNILYLLRNRPLVFISDMSADEHYPAAIKGYLNFIIALNEAIEGKFNPDLYKIDGKEIVTKDYYERLKYNKPEDSVSFEKAVNIISDVIKQNTLDKQKLIPFKFKVWAPSNSKYPIEIPNQEALSVNPVSPFEVGGATIIFMNNVTQVNNMPPQIMQMTSSFLCLPTRYCFDDGLSKVFKKSELAYIEYAKKLIEQIQDVMENPSSPVKTDVADTKGGIDFRAMPVVTQNLVNSSRFPPQIVADPPMAGTAPNLSKKIISSLELQKQWAQIENMVNSGLLPSSERIREYIGACCGNKDIDMNIQLGKVLSCIAGILKLEEEKAQPTDPRLRELIVLLESGKPAGQLYPALASISFSAKEPQMPEF